MINPYRTLSERLPERLPAGKDALPGDPRSLRAWVEGLPRANQQAYLLELGQALDGFRNRRFDGFARLEAMEALRPALLEALTLLTSRLQGSTFPLGNAKAETASQLMALHRELALGYRLAVVEACAPGGKAPFLRGGQVALALERAAYHHVRWLGASYFLYRPAEPRAWANLYALAAFAESQGLAGKAVEDPAERSSLTVALLQNQAVLMSLANPYRFSQRELVDLWTLTRDVANLAELTPQRFSAAGSLVLVDTDTAPMFFSRAPDPDEGDVLWVDLRKLEALMRATLSHAGGARDAVLRLSRQYSLTLPVGLLERALEGWDQDASRSFTRLDGGYALDIVVGLSGLHYHMAEQQDFDGFLRDVRGMPAMAVQRASWTHGSVDSTRVPSVETRVLDQSLGGYRVRWDAAQGVRARIGELVGLSLPLDGETRDWSVGLVRWLRYDEDGAMEAGIDLIARRGHAVALRALDIEGSSQAPVRAIGLMPMDNQTAEGEREVFLVDSVAGLDGPRIEVVRNGNRWDFEEGDGAKIYDCGQLKVLRRNGDYLLVAGERA